MKRVFDATIVYTPQVAKTGRREVFALAMTVEDVQTGERYLLEGRYPANRAMEFFTTVMDMTGTKSTSELLNIKVKCVRNLCGSVIAMTTAEQQSEMWMVKEGDQFTVKYYDILNCPE